jgi:hypothetical protein
LKNNSEIFENSQLCQKRSAKFNTPENSKPQSSVEETQRGTQRAPKYDSPNENHNKTVVMSTLFPSHKKPKSGNSNLKSSQITAISPRMSGQINLNRESFGLTNLDSRRDSGKTEITNLQEIINQKGTNIDC